MSYVSSKPIVCVAFEGSVVCAADKDVLIAWKNCFRGFLAPRVDSGISHASRAAYLSVELIVVHENKSGLFQMSFDKKGII